MITTTVEQIAYERCQESWGGATLCVTTNQFVPDDAIGYVFATGDTIEILQESDFSVFSEAIAKLTANNPDAEYFGFFHDDVKGTIDLNPVSYVKTRAEVDDAYANGNPIDGGAYELATGNGYWPQGRPDLYA